MEFGQILREELVWRSAANKQKIWKKWCQIVFQIGDYNEISAMFENQKFLNSYLPIHFRNLLSRTVPPCPSLGDGLELIKFISQFLSFSYRLYRSINLEYQFSQYFSQNFYIRAPNSQKHSGNTKGLSECKKFIQTILTQYGQIVASSLQLYFQLIYFNSTLGEKGFIGDQKQEYVQQMSSLCHKIRLYFELERMQNPFQSTEFDEYIQKVFEAVFQWDLCEYVICLIQGLLHIDVTNFSENTIHQIQAWIQKKQQSSEDRVELMNVEGRKGRTISIKKIPKKRNLEILNLEKEYSNNFTRTVSFSTNSIDDEDSKQSSKRISEYIKAQKHKMISKERTMYHQRKNTYIPKKTYALKNQYRTLESDMSLKSEEKTQAKKYMEDDMEEDSVLVRSTPIMMKKTSVKMITQKLEFNNL